MAQTGPVPSPPAAHGALQIDHVVVAVEDLAASAQAWRGLGFTVSPMGRHSPSMGTINHTVMFGRDYLELLAVEAPTPTNAEWRGALARSGPGLHGVAMASEDVAGLAAAWTAAGIAATPVIEFSRPVPLPAGGEVPAAFRVISAPPGTLAGLKLFACEHLTRDAVWLPDLVTHPNTARALVGFEMAVPDPTEAAAAWLRAGATAGADGATLALGRHRVVLSAAPGAPRVTALWLQVADLGACAAALGVARPAGADRLRAGPMDGLDIVFTQGDGPR